MSNTDNKPNGTIPTVRTPDEGAGNNDPQTGPTTRENAPVVNPANASPSPSGNAKEEETVTVSKAQFEQLLADMASMKKAQTELEGTASQDQIRKLDALRASGRLVKAVKIRKFNGKLVIGWQVIVDEVYMSPEGKLIEDQKLKLFFEDATTFDTSLIQFSRISLYESYEVVKESKNAMGEMLFTVQLADGKELEINSKFVN